MIDKILALGLTALGATMITKKGNLFIDSSSFSFENFNYEYNDEMFSFIKSYEGFRSTAYYLSGEATYTIGFGQTSWFDLNTGKVVRRVQKGDTITFDMALKQMRAYFNTSKDSPKLEIDAIIRSIGVKLNQRFYDMLLQIAYGSRSMHRAAGFRNQYITMLRRADRNDDLVYLSRLLQNNYLYYIQNFANFSTYGLNWSRRSLGVSYYISGLGNWEFSNTYKEIKTPYSKVSL
ncbi:hypothetical protein I6H88_03135 [Elizabethkingia bruuniana]|uniref:Lysozyme n=1 Tax=Elizabethkingia bruuniana TaxID=1756149 RepID=A0A7T7ZYY4_9FLAO|nr:MULTISPECIES: hypothetical protein [Elizabethkingia]KGO10818.1 hypothetical protein KS04_07975 [Elizabethkingia miricola]AQX85894.1 hypothetical protein AYC65_13165 [Elizabethkingia bruuniana]KUY27550.1 hypothetical protein ATB97_17760 [Elizabethkingia bruuniana]OPB63727.1 hypothetical protein BAY12_10085 [Elizabethkingia bruuniana]QDZ61779.1 hypothetical protein EVD20_00915 [Elizabethkingia bruuniana]